MIQRIQTIYLLLVVLFAVLFLLLPLGYGAIDGVSAGIGLLVGNALTAGMTAVQGWVMRLLILLAILVIALAVFIIFQYRKRPYQIRLGKINILLHIGILVASFFWLDSIEGKAGLAEFTYGPAIFLPLISMFLILMANRAIAKDERLVRAADRIR